MRANNLKAIFILFAALIGSMSSVFAARNSTSTETRTIKKGKFTLQFTCKSVDFNEEINAKLINTFFKVYPTLVKTYNKKSPHLVTFVIDPEYDGIAATSNDRVVFSTKYMTRHPGDIDIVTHEVMHIVQAYGRKSGMPGWLTEGIADYVRYAYGVDNSGAGWKLPDFSEKQNYQNSYRITARFFAWLEQSGYKGIVKKLDRAGRDKTYENGAIWKKLTGKTIDELWTDYSKNPSIS
jgi:hypothetical protein